MSNVRLLHIADTHIRDTHLGSFSRGPDFTHALRWSVEYAIKEQLACIAHGGDLLQSNKPSSKNMEDLFEIHQLARDAKMPVYTVTGNHDLAVPSWTQVISDTFGESEYGFVCADHRHIKVPGTTLTIQGLPFMSRDELVKTLDTCERADILIWHGLVKEFVGFPVEGAVELDDFIVGKFRAVLLGDIHVREYKIHHNVLIGYPGSTELCERSEALEKYVNVLEVPTAFLPIESGQPTKVRIPTRPVRCFRINTEDDLSRILAELQQEKFDRPPLIFIAYNAEVTGVIMRIKNAVSADAIVRYEALQDSKLDFASSAAPSMVEAGVELQELVGSFLPAGPLKDLAVMLTSSDVNAKDAIATFVETRLQARREAAK